MIKTRASRISGCRRAKQSEHGSSWRSASLMANVNINGRSVGASAEPKRVRDPPRLVSLSSLLFLCANELLPLLLGAHLCAPPSDARSAPVAKFDPVPATGGCSGRGKSRLALNGKLMQLAFLSRRADLETRSDLEQSEMEIRNQFIRQVSVFVFVFVLFAIFYSL